MNDIKVSTAEVVARPSPAAPPPVEVKQAVVVQKVDISKQVDQLAERREVSAHESKQLSEKRSDDARKDVKEAVTKLNDYVQSVQRDLRFTLDEESGKTVITVVDRSTNQVIRQLPDDVALRLARDLHQKEPLSLFQAKV